MSRLWRLILSLIPGVTLVVLLLVMPAAEATAAGALPDTITPPQSGPGPDHVGGYMSNGGPTVPVDYVIVFGPITYTNKSWLEANCTLPSGPWGVYTESSQGPIPYKVVVLTVSREISVTLINSINSCHTNLPAELSFFTIIGTPYSVKGSPKYVTYTFPINTTHWPLIGLPADFHKRFFYPPLTPKTVVDRYNGAQGRVCVFEGYPGDSGYYTFAGKNFKLHKYTLSSDFTNSYLALFNNNPANAEVIARDRNGMNKANPGWHLEGVLSQLLSLAPSVDIHVYSVLKPEWLAGDLGTLELAMMDCMNEAYQARSSLKGTVLVLPLTVAGDDHPTLRALLEVAKEYNFLVVAAAGNDSTDFNVKAYPAFAVPDNVIFVAGSNRGGERSCHSNYATSMVAFPAGDSEEGVSQNHAYCKIPSSNDYVWSAISINGVIKEVGLYGTSFSTGGVAGLAALLIDKMGSQGQWAAPFQVRKVITDNATNNGGFRIVNPEALVTHGHWPLRNNANDISGYDHHGTVYGAVFTGLSARFDGNDDRIVLLKSNGNLKIVQFLTIEAWIWNDSFGGDAYHHIFDAYGAYALSVYQGKLAMAIGSWWYPDVPLAVNTWYHVVGTFDGTTQRLYVNGQEVASRSLSRTIPGGYQDYQIGGHNSSYSFHGEIADVRVYDTALPADVIQRHYNSEKGYYQPPQVSLNCSQIAVRTWECLGLATNGLPPYTVYWNNVLWVPSQSWSGKFQEQFTSAPPMTLNFQVKDAAERWSNLEIFDSAHPQQ